MGISAIGGSTSIMSFQQVNRKVDSEGMQKASAISQRAGDVTRVSNFGNETNLGQSRFQQTNAQVSAKFDSVASAYRQSASLGSTNTKGALVDIGA